MTGYLSDNLLIPPCHTRRETTHGALDDLTDLSVDSGHGIESMRSFLQTMMHGLGGVTPPFPHRLKTA